MARGGTDRGVRAQTFIHPPPGTSAAEEGRTKFGVESRRSCTAPGLASRTSISSSHRHDSIRFPRLPRPPARRSTCDTASALGRRPPRDSHARATAAEQRDRTATVSRTDEVVVASSSEARQGRLEGGPRSTTRASTRQLRPNADPAVTCPSSTPNQTLRAPSCLGGSFYFFPSHHGILARIFVGPRGSHRSLRILLFCFASFIYLRAGPLLTCNWGSAGPERLHARVLGFPLPFPPYRPAPSWRKP